MVILEPSGPTNERPDHPNPEEAEKKSLNITL